ncbi:MAG: NAD-dependent epimerase/dehydratase family protein, partial [Sinomicrobium sp.]|nr:NAD-dependent epimerase/dehydratase family protein [Sinomicrobium sp.]
MKLLITGATGLIGSEIVKLSLRKNYAVNYLTTSVKKITNTELLRGFHWAPERGEIDMKCFEGVDAVINLAGASIAKRWTPAYKKKIVHSRTSALELLGTAMGKLERHRIATIVTASAIGIYPNSLVTHYE